MNLKIKNRPSAQCIILGDTLTKSGKFCENFQVSRISADKRFLMYVKTTSRLALFPNRGFCVAVCAAKLAAIFHSRNPRFASYGFEATPQEPGYVRA